MRCWKKIRIRLRIDWLDKDHLYICGPKGGVKKKVLLNKYGI